MLRLGYGLLLLLLLPGAAHPHSAPIPPSVCTFDPIDVAAPAVALAAVAAAPSATDTLQMRYDAAASAVQFRSDAVAPRAFAGSAFAGALTLPAFFQARLQANGDLFAGDVPVTLVVNAAQASAAVALTTGLVSAGGLVFPGAPLNLQGDLTLVAVFTSGELPSPLAGQELLLRFACRASPPPDLDQFVSPAITRGLTGHVAASGAKLRATVRPGFAEAPDFAAAPALLRLSVDGVSVASTVFPGGLTPRGRRLFAVESDDGHATLTVKLAGRGAAPGYKFVMRFDAPTMPSPRGGKGEVELTVQSGRFLSRSARTFRWDRRGRLKD